MVLHDSCWKSYLIILLSSGTTLNDEKLAVTSFPEDGALIWILHRTLDTKAFIILYSIKIRAPSSRKQVTAKFSSLRVIPLLCKIINENN